MYEIDERDEVVELSAVPQSSVGAPGPVVLADELKVLLAYYLQDTPANWDGTTVRVVGKNSVEPAAIVEFRICYDHMFGAPNHEAFAGHPLASRGLRPYGAHEVVNSSWIRQLERMNAVHPYHDPKRFWRRHHYIFAFHDSTFECMADRFRVVETNGSMKDLLPMMVEKLCAEG
jgi:hypothetical protein